ncbi:alpha/beta fold hydrolase [Mycolicibacterium pulveris]|uniref:Epoxide hydrolase n=1 Tax=Mycolicibacterium pulveris TaxID=36813 RepID=A0A7I7ULM3_MYCPV|nr:alpha/beta fold hydrolase [Mycolicibacterium pulveris]MCV6981197.1 alpha/beta fold hydrolase [Mycolicibacterium pulveris]BBY82364.1 epoxide hydrolase [Mycolicibacterium pulveris]
MDEPGFIDVAAPGVTLRVLTWGPPDAPIALCLHGFPDTAHGWRKVAPLLVDAGWRVVAPFMRGYAPSSLASDGSYHIGALMDDALRVLDAAGPTGRDVFIGHDWGAIAGAGLAAMPDSPFTKAVIMSVPMPASFQPLGRVPDAGRLATQIPRQLLRSWYIMYFQLPWLPERSAKWVVPRLWRQWSPGYRADEDVRHVEEAIGAPDRWRAALGYYRAAVRNTKPPAQYAELHSHWLSAPRMPTLYLHGLGDGCASADYAHWVERVLPEGSAVALVERAGHFLQLEQPEAVARHIVDFIGRPSG